MTRLEAIITEQLAPVVTAIDDKVRIHAMQSALDDLCTRQVGLEQENRRLKEAMENALAAIVAGDTRAAAGALRGALR